MKKLIQGIVEFRKNVQESYREAFGKLATGQSPDTLFIACSDSRVVPNVFASTNPGELFVMRNLGNMIPASNRSGASSSDESEAAAIEFAVLNLGVRDIVVCGHSECGAMRSLVAGRQTLDSVNLKSWLRHGDVALERLRQGDSLDRRWSEHNQLSQLNVLLQIENVKSYPAVRDRVADEKLGLHGWWFDIARAEVYAYEDELKKFVLIDEEVAERIFKRLEAKQSK